MTKGIADTAPADRQGRGSAPPYSNLRRPLRRPPRGRCYRAVPPGTIPRGPYAGLPKRPEPERQRYLSFDQVAGLANALSFADSLGRPLSVQLTVAWDLMPGFDPADWSAHQTQFVKAMSEWLMRRGIVPTYVWVREASASLWWHTHIQLHLPKARTAQRAGELVAYLTRRFDFEPGGIVAELGEYGMWSRSMRAGGLRYWLKGIDHRDFRYLSPSETVNIGAAIGIEHRGTQGVVLIKRAGTSQNLGRAARRAASWTERRRLEDLRAILLPPETPKAKAKLLLGRRGLRPVYLGGHTARGTEAALPKGPPRCSARGSAP